MIRYDQIGWSAALALVLAAGAAGQEAKPEDDDWPRVIGVAAGTIIIQPPQVEALEGDHLTARAAVEVTPKGDKTPIEGVVWFKARFLTDRDHRTVTFPDVTVERLVFADASEENVRRVKMLIESDLLGWDLEVSLDRFSAGLRALEKRAGTPPPLKTEPPKILFAEQPTELVLVDGEPKLREIEGTKIMQVVNTPVFMAHDPAAKAWYVELVQDWYQAPAITGPWQKCDGPPGAVKAAREHIAAGAPPAKGDEPPAPAPEGPVALLVATEPTELVVSEGQPEWTPIQGTSLMFLANADADVFKHGERGCFVLLSGRWFNAKALEGPWSFVKSDALPADFARIPADSPQARVRAFVAGTDEAEDALLDAQVPQTAAIKRSQAKLEVVWDGEPQFEACEGDIGVEYGVNTAFAVFRVKGRYYCCNQGVWFEATEARGPWIVCDKVPQEIYSIPPSCPNYSSRYCQVYDSNEDEVWVGYTSGYVGCYPYYGSVVYGTGWYYPYWYGGYWYPRPVTYGCAVRYNAATGHWNVAAGVRGPYGGVGVIGGPNGWVAVGVGGACGVWGGAWGGRPTPYGRVNVYGDVNVNRTVNRDVDRTNLYGQRADLARKTDASRAERRPASRAAQGDRAPPAARPAADRYATKEGRIERRTAEGAVERRQGGEWKRDPAPPQRSREQVARERGAQRTQQYQQYRQSGGWTGSRGGGGSYRGGGGGRGGGGRRR